MKNRTKEQINEMRRRLYDRGSIDEVVEKSAPTLTDTPVEVSRDWVY